jgi:chlorophyll a/b binding light-harvesting protein
MQTYGNPKVEYGWWAGNSRLPASTGKWLAAHIAQFALIVLWTGCITLFEASRYNPDLPMGEQGLILIPHLAALGIGVGPGGVVEDTFPYVAIGSVHLVATLVYAFGAIFHSRLAPAKLSDGTVGRSASFDFDWGDAKKLGFILGHHLILIGIASLLFVGWIRFHGIYDPNVGAVRAVSNPGATILSVIFEYGWFTPGHNPYFVNNLEDLASGHAFIGVVEIVGGIWHITNAPFGWAQRLLGSLFSAEGLLASALAGLSVLGFAAAYYSAVNTLAYPVEFFGPPLDLQFGVAPYFVDTVDLPTGSYTARAWLCNVHFYLAFFILQGHLWHAARAVGFDFKRVVDAFGSLADS